MAKAQTQRFNAMTVWMILFVGLWLTATVFLVILYTGQEELRAEAVRWQKDKAKLISNAELKSIAVAKSGREGGPTVLGLLEEQRARTAELAAGDPNDDPGAILSKLDGVLEAIRNDGVVSRPEKYQDISYHDALTLVLQEYKGRHKTWQDMGRQLAELDAEVNRLVQDNAQQKTDLDKMADELTGRLADAQASHKQYREEREAQVTSIEKEFEVRRQQSENDLTTERQEGRKTKARLERMEARIQAFQARLGEQLPGPRHNATARDHDGVILTAVPGDDVVYINLGKDDRLVLDLEFAVYSGEAGIPSDGRAKARIKVVAISSVSAECEVVRLRPNAVISEGDLIANPVFDPKRPVNFVVLGRFDLDRNGVVDTAGVATIEAIITDWGGHVLPDVTGLTDFVVVGAPPPAPRRVIDASPEQTARNQQLESARERYVNTLTWAETLSVPILPQDVFLNFLGYSGRLARR